MTEFNESQSDSKSIALRSKRKNVGIGEINWSSEAA